MIVVGMEECKEKCKEGEGIITSLSIISLMDRFQRSSEGGDGCQSSLRTNRLDLIINSIRQRGIKVRKSIGVSRCTVQQSQNRFLKCWLLIRNGFTYLYLAHLS